MAKAEQDNKITTLIFDFDGVIADSFNVFVETLEELLQIPPLTKEEIEAMRGASTRDVVKKLGIKKRQLPKLITKGRGSIAEKMYKVKAFSGMPEALNVARKDYKIYILSTNDKKAIAEFLAKYKLSDRIEKIYSGTSLFGKSKRLASLLKHESLNVHECVYIGDETRDIEAAHSIKMRCVAVGWGYADSASLKSYSPDVFISKPSDLVEAVSSLK